VVNLTGHIIPTTGKQAREGNIMNFRTVRIEEPLLKQAMKLPWPERMKGDLQNRVNALLQRAIISQKNEDCATKPPESSQEPP